MMHAFHPLKVSCCRAVAVAAIVPALCFAASPYVAEQARAIKSLSQQNVADYIDGKGMGFAKAAELNGYPAKYWQLRGYAHADPRPHHGH